MAAPPPTRRFGAWDVASDRGGVKLEVRKNLDTGILETRVSGVVGASTEEVWKAITTPVSYMALMPRTLRSVHLDEAPRKRTLHCYQRLSGKPSADRDYTLAIGWEVDAGKKGKAFRRSWTVANDRGPAPEPGVVRVEVNDGTWVLEPRAGKATAFEQTSYIELGGSLLSLLANTAVKDSAVLLVKSLRERFPSA